jgi:acetyl esterase/lipase
MDSDRRILLGLGLAGGLAAASAALGQPQPRLPPTPAAGDPEAPVWPSRETYRIWPGRQPGEPATLPTSNNTMNGPKGRRELWVRGVAHAELHVFRPARPDGSSLLSLPGGGYGFVSVQNEGIDVAQHFNALGTTVFVLVYRLPREGWSDGHRVAIQDAQRAMRFIRAKVAQFDVDPDRLGVLGFSAGGHLAADLATNFDQPLYSPVDDADNLSARPKFAGLVYPVTSLVPLTEDRRLSGMLGAGLSDAVLQARSPVRHVTARTPPSFLVHALDDPLVAAENTLAWIAACRAAKTPVEAHMLAVGGHGFGLHLAKDLPGAMWPDLFARWIRKNGG